MFLSFSKPKNTEDFLKIIIKVLLITALFTPLILDFNFYFPYIVPKNLVFRALIELAFCIYIFLLLRNRTYWPQFNKAFPLFILFIFVLTVSSLLGGTFSFSFWSNFERMDGLVNWLHILMYMFILLGILKSKEDWRAFFDIFLFASWLVAIYGFLQYAEQKSSLEIGFIKSGNTDERIHATFGNAAYLGSYMLIATMLTFNSLVYRLKKGWQWFDTNFWMVIYYVSSIFVFVISMLLSQTRGSMVGLMVFSFLMAIFYFFFNRSKRNKLYYILLALFFATLLFLGFVFQQKDSDWVQSSGVFSRLTAISINHGTSQTRLMTWKSTLQGFKDKPIIGWGEENFKYVFDKYFPIGIYRSQGSEIWFDRPHNILIQHLIQGGILGFLLYIGTFLYLIFALIRNYKKHKQWFFNFFWISFLLSFLIHDLFIFDNLNVNVILYLVLAYLFTVGVRTVKSSSQEFNFGHIKDYVFILVFLIFFLNIFIFMVYNPWKSNKMLIASLNLSGQAKNIDEAQQAVDMWEESISLTDLGDKEKLEVAMKMLNGFVANKNISDQDKEKILINFAEQIQGRLIDLTEQYPDDVRLKMFLVQFYSMTRNTEGKIMVLDNIKKIAPLRPESYINLSQEYLQSGDIEKSLENIEYYASILPKENYNTYVYWNAFQVNLYANDVEAARKYLQKIKEANQAMYNHDFSDGEIKTLRQVATTAETNNNPEIADMVNSYLP